MNKSILKLSTLLLAVMILYSCKPEKVKPLSPAPGSLVPNLAGTWQLASVIQTDADASNKGFPYKQLDVTNLFAYKDFKLTLNVSGNSPTTFTTVQGASPKIIGVPSGNWLVDDPNYPKVLTLAGTSDTVKITLGSYPVEGNEHLVVTLNKHDQSGKLLISYNYVFNKQ